MIHTTKIFHTSTDFLNTDLVSLYFEVGIRYISMGSQYFDYFTHGGQAPMGVGEAISKGVGGDPPPPPPRTPYSNFKSGFNRFSQHISQHFISSIPY